MAVQTEVKLICDFCVGTDAGVQRAIKTRRWGLDGQSFEVELCEKHDNQLDRDMDQWQKVSRRAGSKPKDIGRRTAAKAAVSRAGESYDKAEYVKWAKDKGFNINPEGRPNPRLLRRFLDETKPAKV